MNPGDGRRIRALLFDFDGMILDTESPAYRSWQEVYREHGHDLTLADWSAAVGTLGGFDALAHLEMLTGRALDRDGIRSQRLLRKDRLVADEAVRPGVLEYLAGAERLGLVVAIVSSDSRDWIEGNLARIGVGEGWAGIFCADHDRARAKPAPTLYLEALTALGLEPSQAVAMEDSPNGIRAAKGAGLFCVAVPNPVTAGMDLGQADLVVASLADLPLEELLAKASAGG